MSITIIIALVAALLPWVTPGADTGMTATNNGSVPRRLTWRVVVRTGGQGKLDPSRPSRPLAWHLTTCANPERVDAHCAEGRRLIAASDDPEGHCLLDGVCARNAADE